MVKPHALSGGASKSKASLIVSSLLAAVLMAGTLGCSAGSNASAASSSVGSGSASSSMSGGFSGGASQQPTSGSGSALIEGSALDTDDLFTDRDLQQEADLSSATRITLTDGEDVSITDAGVYSISGSASDVTITINATDKDAKVQLVLDGASITNADFPAIYVVAADKVFVTTTAGSTNSLSVTGAFKADGDTNTDAVIFSRADVVLNGSGTLNISSSDNGVSSKDLVKVTGGTLNITSSADGIEANDGIALTGGTISINTKKDALNAGKDDDDTVGFVYIAGGTLNINAADQGIKAQTVAQIDGGDTTIVCSEGIEATYVQINGGSLDISASDDGINAALNTSIYDAIIDIKGGSVTVTMGSGDTDALDANGSIFISGGTVNITAQSPFDYDVSGAITGGTVTVNGSKVTEMTNQMMGPGGGRGAMQGGQAAGSGSMGAQGGGPR